MPLPLPETATNISVRCMSHALAHMLAATHAASTTTAAVTEPRREQLLQSSRTFWMERDTVRCRNVTRTAAGLAVIGAAATTPQNCSTAWAVVVA